MIIDLTEDGYHTLGESKAVEGEGVMEKIASVLPEEGPGLTVAEVRERVGFGVHRVRELLQECLDHGLIDRAGSGKRSDPFRYGRKTQMLL